MVALLGFPLRERPDAPQTYVVPNTRRKAIPAPPPASAAPHAPEPALDDATYDHVLSVIASMVRVIERSPNTFAGLNEEALRTHLLVQLNGHYDGAATGETFNGSGSTDILLQTKNKSVFIAECEFWDGQASLTKAIDQLLGYATWRDAKTAILIFSRQANFSGVVEAIPSIVAAHPAFVRAVSHAGETTFRYELRQRDNPSRRLTLTLLVFNVPVGRPPSGQPRKRARRPTSKSIDK